MAKLGNVEFEVRLPRMFGLDDVVSVLLRCHPAIRSVNYDRGDHPQTIKLSVTANPVNPRESHEARVAAEDALKACAAKLPAGVHIYIADFFMSDGSSGSYASRASVDERGMHLTTLHLNRLGELGLNDAIVREYMKLVESRTMPTNDALVALVEHLVKDRKRLIGLFEQAEIHTKDAFESYREDVVHALKRAVSFLSGLNLQDHPIDVQRESANVLRRFMLALQPNRKELELPKHAWLGDR